MTRLLDAMIVSVPLWLIFLVVVVVTLATELVFWLIPALTPPGLSRVGLWGIYALVFLSIAAVILSAIYGGLCLVAAYRPHRRSS